MAGSGGLGDDSRRLEATVPLLLLEHSRGSSGLSATSVGTGLVVGEPGELVTRALGGVAREWKLP
eukprot:4933184-Alexandrium_andersonii.AAC.1